ncbi:MAG: response regulator [Nitrosopumilus sp.]|nr:response regulator [Nitrosopumilus sp.]
MNCELETIDSAQKTKIILIVDDIEEIKKSFSFIAKSLGFKILLADNGCEAIDVYKEKMPDIVFMDVRMPIKNGCDAFKEIKEFDSNAKIIFMTAFSGDPCILELMTSHHISIIEKPFQLDKIMKILQPNG